MKRKFGNSTQFAVILSLVLVFALSFAWAVQTYSNSKRFRKGEGGNIRMKGARNRTFLHVPAGACDAYLKEKGLKQVNITVDMTEEWIDNADGTGYWQLDFHFGPSGAYFDPPLKLKINGDYVNEGNIWLYDENGELVEGKFKEEEEKLIFILYHFSSYYYDGYDY